MINPPNYVGEPTNSILNVQEFGAKGDGITDDTKAFEAAWQATCEVKEGVLLVPAGTFLLQPITFFGTNCQENLTFEVNGEIVAPPNLSGWKGVDFQWIQFLKFSNGITIQGNGVIDGRGQAWWKINSENTPHAIRIAKSNKVTVTGIKIQNSPRMHIFFDECQQVTIFGLTLSSPQESPNTDGIHLSHTQHVEIYNSIIGCGDDCVSIQTGSSDVRIHDVQCGPGHGYSIGGLGPNNEEAEVTDVHVYDSTVADALTGVRIKTWRGGSGFVNNVTFSHLTMTDVKTPIVIDQNYCNGKKDCTSSSTNAVTISGVTYENITGTYIDQSVSLVCSEYQPCKNILMGTIDLTPSPTKKTKGILPQCENAFGRVLTETTPSLKNCLLPEVNAEQPTAFIASPAFFAEKIIRE
ncbi:hypothetical protein RD792_016602 [Penstemon davidsonii]|uniref:Polygalacturonase n=1 Tax=Penstemon davidsonii TaxID=160366 RepID=A0ABR0CLP2_9LAMI|nr:hypothetical protein RD792_016602 [Penstemon davidsonii]